MKQEHIELLRLKVENSELKKRLAQAESSRDGWIKVAIKYEGRLEIARENYESIFSKEKKGGGTRWEIAKHNSNIIKNQTGEDFI